MLIQLSTTINIIHLESSGILNEYILLYLYIHSVKAAFKPSTGFPFSTHRKGKPKSYWIITMFTNDRYPNWINFAPRRYFNVRIYRDIQELRRFFYRLSSMLLYITNIDLITIINISMLQIGLNYFLQVETRSRNLMIIRKQC